jgi:signal transduction histidine kinase/response regulator of citrate/malate metabolism
MNDKTTSSNTGMVKFIAAAVFLAVMFFMLLYNVTPDMPAIRSVNAGRGEIIIRPASEFDFENELFLLNGEWEYYPNRLLYSEDFAGGRVDNVRFVKFPHSWSEDKVNFPDGKGYATYRITLTTPVQLEGAGLFTNYQYGAYRVFLNGHVVAEGGNVSENRDEYYFAFNASGGYVHPYEGAFTEVIVHIQSYDHAAAGLTNDIIVGSYAAIARYREILSILSGMTIGAVLVLVFYFLLIFIRNRDKSEYVNFAILSMCALYLSLTNLGESYAYYLVPAIPFRLIYSFEHVSLALGAYFSSMHIIRKYIKFKHIGKIGIIYTGFNCMLALALPSFTFSAIRWYTHVSAITFVVAAFVISLICTIMSSFKENRNSLSNPILEPVSLLVLVSGVAINLLGFRFLSAFDLFPVAIVLYGFIQIFVLSKYYNMVGKDLVTLTKTLETRVDERTAALADVNRRVESANDLKSEFLTRMSHEMRTPMNAIVSMSELFDTENLSETQKNYFRDIKETSHTLLNLINDILDFAKIEAGKLELVPAHFILKNFIDDICAAAKFSADIKGLKFESIFDKNLPEVIVGDEIRIKQVIVNIISNAIKYTQAGSVAIEVRIATRAKSDGTDSMLLFVVRDTGIGMRKENIPKMFDAFMNPNSSKSRGLKGVGLGLAICKSLMEMQKGAIEFDSDEGKGSVFRLYFPLTIGDKSLVEETQINEKIYAKNAKILLVEDNTINVTVALGILAAHGIRPDVAKDGYKALSMVREKDYDLVFMDQFMPGMDGIETTQRIREFGGKYTALPVIAMTANAVQGVRDMLIFKGMNDYLSKPVDHNQLNNILIRWLPHDKTSSSIGRFSSEQSDEVFGELPKELVEITEINCSTALKNMDGNLEIYMGLLRQFAKEAYDYAESLSEYLKNNDSVNYIIVINGAKSLLYNIGAKSYGDMAARLEDAAGDKNIVYCNEKNDTFCKSLRWLSQRVSLALPQEKKAALTENGGNLHESAKLVGVMRELSSAFLIGDCDAIDEKLTLLKELSSGGEHNKVIADIIREAGVMEYGKAAELCSGFLETPV